MGNRSTHAPAAQSDREEVLWWRRQRLLAAGFEGVLASELADDCAVDVHALLELVDRGCSPPLAARILAPLDQERRPA